MALNAAQIDVLTSLQDGAKGTSNYTNDQVVSGISSKALERKGLVKIKELKDGSNSVILTAAGRKALKAVLSAA